jgi:hypothetical protein
MSIGSQMSKHWPVWRCKKRCSVLAEISFPGSEVEWPSKPAAQTKEETLRGPMIDGHPTRCHILLLVLPIP